MDRGGSRVSYFSFEPCRERVAPREGRKPTHPLASKRSFLASTLTTQPSWPPRLATCPLRPPVTPAPADVAVKARRSNTLMRLSSEPVMSRFEVKEMERIGAAWAVREMTKISFRLDARVERRSGHAPGKAVTSAPDSESNKET